MIKMIEIVSYAKFLEYTRILGVSTDPTEEELKAVFYSKMKILHPDTNKPTANLEESQKISEAYHALLKVLPFLKELGKTSLPEQDIHQKKILYYCKSERIIKHYGGIPVFKDIFMNIETNREEVFYSSSAWQEILEQGYPCCSANPDDYEREEYVIWQKYYSGDQISIRKITTPFEEVRELYLSLLGTLSREEIATALLDKFTKNEKKDLK
jgi:hypothetical protein